MNKSDKKLNVTPIAAFIFAALFLVGCGDSEMTKEITSTVKKSVEGEITKQVGKVRKQFDQIINLGAGNGQKENGQNSAVGGKENSEKGSGEGSEEKDD